MTQIKLFEGTPSQICKKINEFLAQGGIQYVDIKFQMAASTHVSYSAILVYDTIAASQESEEIKLNIWAENMDAELDRVNDLIAKKMDKK